MMNFQGEINDTRRLLAVEAQEPVGVVHAVNAPWRDDWPPCVAVRETASRY